MDSSVSVGCAEFRGRYPHHAYRRIVLTPTSSFLPLIIASLIDIHNEMVKGGFISRDFER